MEGEKFQIQLSMILLMTQNRKYTREEICKRTNISRRTFFRTIAAFKKLGFVIKRKRDVYSVDKSSPFFMQITELVHFTENEAITLRRLLNAIDDTNIQARYLKTKLDRIYDFNIISDIDFEKEYGHHIESLYDAIKQNKQVILHDYNSSNSNTTSDRKVEPFEFLNGNSEVRCYEMASQMSKTFKISRIGSVEVLPDNWKFKRKHKNQQTDLFMFSAEKTTPVTLRMTRLAANLLIEEYPRSRSQITQENEDSWIIHTEVCSFKGIGRFVLGLYENIEIIDSPKFQRYIDQKITDYARLRRKRKQDN